MKKKANAVLNKEGEKEAKVASDSKEETQQCAFC